MNTALCETCGRRSVGNRGRRVLERMVVEDIFMANLSKSDRVYNFV